MYREDERERETDRQRDRERQTDRQTETGRQRDRKTDRDRQSETDREGGRESTEKVVRNRKRKVVLLESGVLWEEPDVVLGSSSVSFTSTSTHGKVPPPKDSILHRQNQSRLLFLSGVTETGVSAIIKPIHPLSSPLFPCFYPYFFPCFIAKRM